MHQKANMRKKSSKTLTEEKAWDKKIVKKLMEYDKNNKLKSNHHYRMTDRKEFTGRSS